MRHTNKKRSYFCSKHDRRMRSGESARSRRKSQTQGGRAKVHMRQQAPGVYDLNHRAMRPTVASLLHLHAPQAKARAITARKCASLLPSSPHKAGNQWPLEWCCRKRRTLRKVRLAHASEESTTSFAQSLD